MDTKQAKHPVYAVVAAAIAREGVRHMFGLMGAATIRLTTDLMGGMVSQLGVQPE
jgi:hypothetical protein